MYIYIYTGGWIDLYRQIIYHIIYIYIYIYIYISKWHKPQKSEPFWVTKFIGFKGLGFKGFGFRV